MKNQEDRIFRLSGEQFIKAVADRLTQKGIPCYDSNIVKAIQGLSHYELNMVVFEGTCRKWYNEMVNHLEES